MTYTSPTTPPPNIGQLIHYVDANSNHIDAEVIQVMDSSSYTCAMRLVTLDGVIFKPYNATPTPETWHFPESATGGENI